MAKTPLATGLIEEVTTRTRVLDEKKDSGDDKTPRLSFWEYVAKLSLEDWKKHIIYVYRGPMRGGKYITKFMSAIKPDQIAEKFGGGDYTLVLNNGPEMIYKEEFSVDGTPITNAQPFTPGASDGTQTELAGVLSRMTDMIERLAMRASGGEGTSLILEGARRAMDIQGDGLKSAAATITSMNSTPGAAAAQSPEQRMREMLEMFTLMRNAFSPATNSVKDTLDMITTLKGAGLFGSPRESVLGTLVASAPQLLDRLVDGLKYYSTIQTNNINAALIQRGATPVPQVTPPATLPATPPPSAPNPPAAAAQTPGREPWMDVLETQILNIYNTPDLPMEDLVAECLACTDGLSPMITDQLAAQGENGLLLIFRSSPILSVIPQDARLTEFVRAFLVRAKEKPAASKVITIPATQTNGGNTQPAAPGA